MLADYLIIFCGSEVVAIAEQLAKVSINSFCNGYNATFSNTGKGRKLRVNSKYYTRKTKQTLYPCTVYIFTTESFKVMRIRI